MTGYDSKRQMAANKLWDRPSVAFDEWWNGDNDESTNPFRLESGAYWAWAGWKAALAQPAQEPVAWMSEENDCIFFDADKPNPMDYEFWTPLYTVPPKRKWVGLTDEEIDAIYWQHENHCGEYKVSIWPYERAIEAKLKEKNT